MDNDLKLKTVTIWNNHQNTQQMDNDMKLKTMTIWNN